MLYDESDLSQPWIPIVESERPVDWDVTVPDEIRAAVQGLVTGRPVLAQSPRRIAEMIVYGGHSDVVLDQVLVVLRDVRDRALSLSINRPGHVPGDAGCDACGTCLGCDGCADSDNPIEHARLDCETCGACGPCIEACRDLRTGTETVRSALGFPPETE